MTYIPVDIEADPTDLAEAAYEYLETEVPGWLPSPGNLEAWLIEALSQMAGELRALALLVPNEIFGYYGESIANTPPFSATPATGTTTWTMVDTAGYTVDAGSLIAVSPPASLDSYAFSVQQAFTVPPGQKVQTGVLVESVEPGSEASGLTGTVDVIDPLAFVSTVTLDAATAGGTDDEDPDAYIARLSDLMTLLSPRPILAPDFAILAQKTVPGVARATSIDLWKGDTGTPNVPRCVSVAAVDVDGEPGLGHDQDADRRAAPVGAGGQLPRVRDRPDVRDDRRPVRRQRVPDLRRRRRRGLGAGRARRVPEPDDVGRAALRRRVRPELAELHDDPLHGADPGRERGDRRPLRQVAHLPRPADCVRDDRRRDDRPCAAAEGRDDHGDGDGRDVIELRAAAEPQLAAPPSALEPDSFASRLYVALAPVGQQDSAYGWALLILCNAIGTMFQDLDDLVRDSSDGPGWSEIVDLDRCPSWALDWLGQFVGVRMLPNSTDAQKRARIASTDGWKRGTPAALEAAIRATLTGTRSVVIRERDPAGADPPYSLSVRTLTSETPDATATLSAALSQKPGGLVLNYAAVTGQDYAGLKAKAATYAAMKTMYPTYDSVRQDF